VFAGSITLSAATVTHLQEDFKRLNLSEKTVKLIFFHVKGKMTDVRPS
jgi:hypothetical protein